MFHKYKLIFIIPFNNIAMQYHLWCNKLSYVYDIAFLNTGTVKFYVKMTNKKINTRIKEHIADFRCNKRTTALVRLQNRTPLQIGLKKIIEVISIKISFSIQLSKNNGNLFYAVVIHAMISFRLI